MGCGIFIPSRNELRRQQNQQFAGNPPSWRGGIELRRGSAYAFTAWQCHIAAPGHRLWRRVQQDLRLRRPTLYPAELGAGLNKTCRDQHVEVVYDRSALLPEERRMACHAMTK